MDNSFEISEFKNRSDYDPEIQILCLLPKAGQIIFKSLEQIFERTVTSLIGTGLNFFLWGLPLKISFG